MGAVQTLSFNCPACNKRYPWQAGVAGKKAKCDCGQIIVIPAKPAAAPRPLPEDPSASMPSGDFDAAPGLALAPARAPRRVAASSIPVDALIAAARMRKRAEAEARERAESAGDAGTSILRNWTLPTIIMGVGLILIFAQTMLTTKPAIKNQAQALAPTALCVVLHAGLVLLGALLVSFAGVSLSGSLAANLFTLCAIAIGPAATVPLMVHAMGEITGAMAGVFTALIVYILLFRLLLRTDAQATALFVTATWILLTLADFLTAKGTSLLFGFW